MGFSSLRGAFRAQSAFCALNVIGNNLANVNTIGTKEAGSASPRCYTPLRAWPDSTAALGANGGGSPYQVGMGSDGGHQRQLFSRSLQPTEVVTDLGIREAAFVLRNNADVPVYGRAGNFSFDAEGVPG